MIALVVWAAAALLAFKAENNTQLAYWLDFFSIDNSILLSILIIAGSVCFGILYWIFTEKLRLKRRKIAIQYKPPQNLRPAMAEIIAMGELTRKGVAATIIDMAVRGQIKIKESRFKGTFLGRILIPILIILPAIYAFTVLPLLYLAVFLIGWIVIPLWALRLEYVREIIRGTIIRYRFTPLKKRNDLEEFEKDYLKFINLEEDAPDEVLMSFLKKMAVAKKNIFHETRARTNAFKKIPLLFEFDFWLFLTFMILSGILLINFDSPTALTSLLLVISTTVACILWLVLFLKRRLRLSEEGEVLKEKLLGFKMYLETIEKHRLQKLTPGLFEKYLPYALVFGIEKKWAKTFEPLHLSTPPWYSSSTFSYSQYHGEEEIFYTGKGNIASPAAFSTLVFSANLSSSFANSLSKYGIRMRGTGVA